MDDIEVFFLIVIPASLLFIFLMTRKPGQPSEPDEASEE